MRTIENRSAIYLALAAGAIFTLAGCGQESEGDARPSPLGTSETAGERASETAEATKFDPLVPRVANPKNIDDTLPCDLLTADQATELGFAAEGVEDTTELGTTLCRWTNTETRQTVSLFPEEEGTTLSAIYAQEDQYQVFEPVEIAEHPAIRTKIVATELSCEILLGLSDDQLLVVSADRGGMDDLDACEWASEVAEAAVENLGQ
ncbi:MULTISPECIES: DUF3558 domain-containing protein [Actinoalloteichus]|uniref:DUF3558 domain-containing protein n=1 Tax=Actinoalloteichus TaxID=65496 RepID=UPI0009520181|nr:MULTISPECIES: DUF3558 domain-containing protein [Actinoalloteichus]